MSEVTLSPEGVEEISIAAYGLIVLKKGSFDKNYCLLKTMG